MDLYRENILDHYNSPRNMGILEHADYKFKSNNPVCGDEVEIYIKIDKKKIVQISHHTVGCAIAIASASILTEMSENKNFNEIKKINLEDLLNRLGTPLTLSRRQCAQVALDALQSVVKLAM